MQRNRWPAGWRGRATNTGSLCPSCERLASIQTLPKRARASPPFRIQLHAHGLRVEFTQVKLHPEQVITTLMFPAERPEPQARPMPGQFPLPAEQIGAEPAAVIGPLAVSGSGGRVEPFGILAARGWTSRQASASPYFPGFGRPSVAECLPDQ